MKCCLRPPIQIVPFVTFCFQITSIGCFVDYNPACINYMHMLISFFFLGREIEIFNCHLGRYSFLYHCSPLVDFQCVSYFGVDMNHITYGSSIDLYICKVMFSRWNRMVNNRMKFVLFLKKDRMKCLLFLFLPSFLSR